MHKDRSNQRCLKVNAKIKIFFFKKEKDCRKSTRLSSFCQNKNNHRYYETFHFSLAQLQKSDLHQNREKIKKTNPKKTK